MKNLLVALLCLVSMPVLQASEIAITIAPRAEDQSQFKLGNVYKGRHKGGFYTPTMLRYYISGITLHLGNGTNVPFPDTYILVDVRDVQRFPIGNADVSAGIDSITFHIGVDQARNHLDPTTYPDWHPLALKNPSMHWGWAAGYRFVTYEGKAGTSAGSINATFQIHTLDDKLYTKCSVPLGGMVSNEIPLVGYYERLLNAIDISRGVINHGSDEEAAVLMANMGQSRDASSAVYTASLPTSVDEEYIRDVVAPNPAQDLVTLPTNATRVMIYDVHGALIQTTKLGTNVNVLSVASIAQGTYLVVIEYDHGKPHVSHLSIVR